MKKCFVVMGFGKKMDYRTSRMVDLDVTYKKVIKPVFEADFEDYEVLRADEICRPGSIEKDMYEMLLKADLVIADISTYNENAIYELGVRHALKPASTIIMMQKDDQGNDKFPFDINHFRIISYNNLEKDIDGKNAGQLKEKLAEFISACDTASNKKPDSPVYVFLKDLCPPEINEKLSAETVEDTRATISQILAEANKYMSLKEFNEAADCWKRLYDIMPYSSYVVQQWALTRYKSKTPDEKTALDDGFEIITKLKPEKSLDIETLGIAGAICKRLHQVTGEELWLKKAIKYYRKGFMIDEDYYTGEIYANCLLRNMTMISAADDEYIAMNVEREKVCRTVIDNLLGVDGENGVWEYASLAVCSYHLDDVESYEKYRREFLRQAMPWMKDTFEETIRELKSIFEHIVR